MRRVLLTFPLLARALRPLAVLKQAMTGSYIRRAAVGAALGRVFAEPPLISVPEFDGVFRVDARSDLFRRIILDCKYEPALAALCRMLIDRDRDVIDVGANIGFFTVLAAKATERRVCAIEPTEGAAQLLLENVRRNSVDERVQIITAAASDVEGATLIHVIFGKEEYASLCEIKHPSVRYERQREVEVRCVTLDGIVATNGLDPGLVKIDVEGAEGKVFDGGWTMIQRHRPVVLSELSPYLLRQNGTDPKVIIETLRDLRYRVVDPLMPQIPVGRREFGDLLAVPQERWSQAQLEAITAKALRQI